MSYQFTRKAHNSLLVIIDQYLLFQLLNLRIFHRNNHVHLYFRDSKAGGGIAIYVNLGLNVNRRSDLEDREIEALWLELCPFKSNCSRGGFIDHQTHASKEFDSKIGMNF
jgi:hypothetical protein